MHCSDRHLRQCTAATMLIMLVCLSLPAWAQALDTPAGHVVSPAMLTAVPAEDCEPQWPVAAPENGDRRATRLMLQINAKGTVIGTRLIQSSGSTALDNATIDTVIGCRFVPALKRGKPAPSKVPFTYAWDQIVHVQQPPPAVAAPMVLPKADFASCRKPAWPLASLRNEETGTVTMDFLIGTDGAVKETRLKRSSGFPGLDNSALEALAKCRFQPGTRSGQPIESWAAIRYVWTLE